VSDQLFAHKFVFDFKRHSQPLHAVALLRYCLLLISFVRVFLFLLRTQGLGGFTTSSESTGKFQTPPGALYVALVKAVSPPSPKAQALIDTGEKMKENSKLVDWSRERPLWLGDLSATIPGTNLERLTYFGWIWDHTDSIKVTVARKADGASFDTAIWAACLWSVLSRRDPWATPSCCSLLLLRRRRVCAQENGPSDFSRYWQRWESSTAGSSRQRPEPSSACRISRNGSTIYSFSFRWTPIRRTCSPMASTFWKTTILLAPSVEERLPAQPMLASGRTTSIG
jgi:hypothetical protein